MHNNDESVALPSEIILELQYGSYYYSTEQDGSFSVFRLLSLDPDVIHYVVFEGTYPTPPTKEFVEKLTPAAQHIPQAVGALAYWKDITLIYHQDLNRDDVAGYVEYLKHMGTAPETIDHDVQVILEFSKQKHTFKLAKTENTFIASLVK